MLLKKANLFSLMAYCAKGRDRQNIKYIDCLIAIISHYVIVFLNIDSFSNESRILSGGIFKMPLFEDSYGEIMVRKLILSSFNST